MTGDRSAVAAERSLSYRVAGMDCASDAAEIEAAVRGLSGVEGVRVSAATHVMTVVVDGGPERITAVERAVATLGYGLGRITAEERATSHLTPAYRRALWIVVLLNLGYGLLEMVGGFLGDSQALKADALDFLGDGAITLLGLLAIGWSLAWRARSALVQGIFLGALGVGVLATTAYRVLVQGRPEAEWMGALGALALLVNVLAAVVLLPHRSGDANARAVWLFSRNDAIGNAAVVAAAGFVAWTGSPWPDLAVAVVIAALFLHSAVQIIRDAQVDLRAAEPGRG